MDKQTVDNKKQTKKISGGRIVLAIFILVILSSGLQKILLTSEKKEYSIQKQEEQLVEEALQQLERDNALYALLCRENPSFREQSKEAVKTVVNNPKILQKWENEHKFYIVDLENTMMAAVLENEFGKYMRNASDEDIYNMYRTEYKHLSKNNCQVFPVSQEDRQETILVKSRLVRNSILQPYKGTLMSDAAAEIALNNVIFFYKKKNYDINKLMIRLGMKQGSLSRDENCQAEKLFYEAILSLPKATCGGLARKMAVN